MNKKLLLIIIVAVVLLGGGGAAAYFILGGEEEGQAEEVKAETQDPPGLVPMKKFIVNLNDRGSDRFVKLEVKLTMIPATMAEKISEDELMIARLRDRILTVVGGKTYDDLSNPMGKETLRRELKVRLADLVTEGEIQDVLFSEFVVQ